MPPTLSDSIIGEIECSSPLLGITLHWRLVLTLLPAHRHTRCHLHSLHIFIFISYHVRTADGAWHGGRERRHSQYVPLCSARKEDSRTKSLNTHVSNIIPVCDIDFLLLLVSFICLSIYLLVHPVNTRTSLPPSLPPSPLILFTFTSFHIYLVSSTPMLELITLLLPIPPDFRINSSVLVKRRAE